MADRYQAHPRKSDVRRLIAEAVVFLAGVAVIVAAMSLDYQ